MHVPFALLDFGAQEMIIIGIVAVLLFGERLPEVGRSFGQKLIEFKKGLSGIQDEIANVTREISSPTSTTDSSSASSSSTGSSSSEPDVDDYAEATAPKFEPPPAEPKATSADP